MESTDYLRRVVDVLSVEIGVRTFREPERLDRAADFISGELASFGYAVTRQPFPYKGSLYQNVIAGAPGAGADDRLLIIGSHYDTVRTTPGADDNASGVAGMLDLARTLSGTPHAAGIRFAAFSLEEPPAYRTRNMGSYWYARSLRESGARVDGMICLEMIGFFRDEPGSQHYPLPFMNLRFPRAGNYLSLVGNLRSKGFTDDVARGFRAGTDLPVITLNAPFFVVGIDFSDHWSFYQFGFPALMATDTAFYRNPHYHAPSDLPRTLDYVRMAKVVQGLRAAVAARGTREQHSGGHGPGGPGDQTA